jgi:hypothetical protein
MGAGRFQKTLASKVFIDIGGHAGIGYPLLRIPQELRDKFYQQRFGRRPWQSFSDRGQFQTVR